MYDKDGECKNGISGRQLKNFKQKNSLRLDSILPEAYHGDELATSVTDKFDSRSGISDRGATISHPTKK